MDRFFYGHPDPMWIYCTQTLRFLAVNRAAEEMYGYSRDEFLALTIADIRPPDEVPRMHAHLASDNRRQDRVWVHRRKNGQNIFVDVRASDIDYEGSCARLVCARNITALVNLERRNQALLQAERKARADAEEAAGVLRVASKIARLTSWEFDPATNLVTLCDQGSKLQGTAPGISLPLEKALEACQPSDRLRLAQALTACARSGAPYEETVELRSAAGRNVWVRAIGEPEFDETGAVVKVRGITQEVSDAMKAREESNSLARRLRETLETMGDAFFLIDHAWRFIYLNRQAEQILRHDGTDILGKHLFDVFPGARGSTFERQYRKAFEQGQPCSFVEYFSPLSAWFEVTANPSTDGLAVYFRDITARRAEQAELHLLQTAVSKINDIVLITEVEPLGDPGPRIVYVNDAFERLTGFSRDEVIGKTPRILQGPKTQRQQLDRVRDALTRRQPTRVEIINYTKSGDEYWLEMDIVPIFDDAGQCTNFVAVERDITQRKRAQAALEESRARLTQQARDLTLARDAAEQANAAKSAFLANMSHEIRTPLNGILGMVQVLEERRLPAEEQDLVATIRECGTGLTTILNDILDFSKIEAGKLDISPSPSPLSDVLRRTEQMFRPAADAKRLALSFVSLAGDENYLFDPVRVQQCVSNLVANAIKFTEAGSISVETRVAQCQGQSVITIVVKDSGIGIEQDKLPKLFSPFTQADGSTTRRFGGTGLGLVISRKLANLMGGDITVESRAGHGSTFTLTFTTEPASRKAVDPVTAIERTGGLQGLRVLLVDDNAVNRKVAGLFLRPHDMIIIEAENGVDALKKLGSGQAFDLVLLDVHMPVMDGVKTIGRIRTSNEPWAMVPVIALTADAMSGDRERLIGLGMNGYVPKPINVHSLLTEIKCVLGMAEGIKPDLCAEAAPSTRVSDFHRDNELV